MHDKIKTGIVIAASVVILFYIVFRMVKRYFRSRFASVAKEEGPAFSIGELQKMYDKGLISKDEFDKLRRRVINDMMK